VSHWFYAEGNRERRGPLPAENIIELFRSGRIAGDTLVWREGAGDWRPLRDFAAELGLDEAAHPPAVSVPPLPPPLQQQPAVPPGTPAPAARPGLSGCAVAGIIAAATLVALLVIGGILAAIAIPAYQEYLLRSKVAGVRVQLAPLKAGIPAYVQDHGRCPVNGDDGFGAPRSYAGGNVEAVRIGRFAEGHCGLEARLQAPGQPLLDGKRLWLDYDSQASAWKCSSDMAGKYLPDDCRG